MPKEVWGAINKLGDFYHKEAYSRIATVTAKLTDRDFVFSDILTLPSIYAPEFLTATLLASASMHFYQRGATLEASSGFVTDLIRPIIITTGGLMATYGLNYFKTPVDKKIGIVPDPNFQPEEDLSFVIDQLNRSQEVPRLTFQQVTPIAQRSVEVFLGGIDGYVFPSSSRAKLSRFGDLMIWKHGALGLLNPFIQEVVVFSDQYPEALAHEFAHLKGIPQERLAEFVGIVAQVHSDEPYVSYIGYRQWMERLGSYLEPDWKESSSDNSVELIAQEFYKRGLNSVTLDEILQRGRVIAQISRENRSYSKYIALMTDSVYRNLPAGIQAKVPEGLLKFLSNFEPSVADGMRSVLMKLTGGGSTRSAYIELPLKLLSSYRKSGNIKEANSF